MRCLSAPFRISLGITGKCNLNCRHCLADTDRHAKDLTTSELSGVINQITKLKVFEVVISGGEPLIRKDFFEIIEPFRNKNTRVSLSTNGTLINNRSIAEELSRSPIRDYRVSIDGSVPRIHDAFRGAKGAFKKSINGIENLLGNKCRVSIITTVTRFNINDLRNIVLLGKRLGVSNVIFNRLRSAGRAKSAYKELAVRPKGILELVEKFKALKKEFNEFIFGYGDWLINVAKNKVPNSFPLVIPPCSAGTTKCAIRPDGWVIPCEMLQETKAGNLKKESLHDIWNHSGIMRSFREPILISEEDVSECKGCRGFLFCYRFPRCWPRCC